MIPMSSTAPRLLACSAALALVLTGCGTAGAEDGGRLSVVAAFYPLQWTAQRVGGDLVHVDSLTPPGAEPHDLELTPKDVGAMVDADLVVHLAGFQPAIDEAAAAEAADHSWDAGTAADLVPVSDASGKDGDGLDPHFWLDPTRLADVGDAVAEQFAKVDPEHAGTYEQNAADLRADLEALDTEVSGALADCAVDTLVTSHEAFGYLAGRYGFEMVGISGISPSQEPDPAALAEIADLVRERGVTTVYTETLVDPAVADTVASEAGVGTAVLDPLEGLTDPDEDYLDVMRANADTLHDGQSCS
jgi:zinc transport system substrate-binding protein